MQTAFHVGMDVHSSGIPAVMLAGEQVERYAALAPCLLAEARCRLEHDAHIDVEEG
jgi:hypothetical protein